MKLTAETSVLDAWQEPITALVDEARIHTNEDGLTVRAVDPANVAMVSEHLDTSAFEVYEADGGILGANMNRLSDIISMGDSDALMTWELNPETRKLEITVGDLDYTLALLDPDSIRSEPDIPDLGLPTHAVMEGRHLKRAVRACDMVSDFILFRTNDEHTAFQFQSEGDTDGVGITVSGDDLLDGTELADAYSMASLDYFKDIQKPVGSEDEITLHVGEEFPVHMDYSHTDGAGDVTFMVAPRIQSE